MPTTNYPPSETPPLEGSTDRAQAHDGHSPIDESLRSVVHRPRGWWITIGVFVIVFVLFIEIFLLLANIKVLQAGAGKKLADSGAFLPPPSAVTTYVVHEAHWQPTLHAIGSLEAVQGVTVAADLPGIVKDILFESGKPVRKGDLLVRLVTDQEQATLESAEANRDLAVYSLKRQKDLREKNTNSQSDLDTADANERQAEAAVSNAKAAIERKTIRAGFDGLLGIRKVNVGQYLNSGDPIVALQSMNPIYVNFTLPQQNLKDFSVGSEVRVHTDATGDQEFAGKVTAINSMVDESTRNFQAQATIANPDGKLRPGMFANVDVLEAGNGDVLPVPSSAINYAPYGNSVFVLVHDMKPDKDDPLHPDGKPYLGVEQHFVTTGQTRGDLVAVLKGSRTATRSSAAACSKCRTRERCRSTTTSSPRRKATRTRRRVSFQAILTGTWAVVELGNALSKPPARQIVASFVRRFNQSPKP